MVTHQNSLDLSVLQREDKSRNELKPPTRPSFHPSRVKRKLSTSRRHTRVFPYRLPDPARRFTDEATLSLTRSLSRSELNRQEAMFNFAMEESLYLLDLHALQDNFATPLMEKRLLNEDDHNDLFGILPRLIKKSEAMVVTLNEITERLPIQKFGSALSYHFKELQPILTEYMGRRPILLEVLASVEEQNSVASAFMENKQTEGVVRGLSLETLLMSPVVRFETYVRVTTLIMELTSTGHPDREHLENALACLLLTQKRAALKDKENEKLLRISYFQDHLDKKYTALFQMYNLEMDAEVEVTTSRMNIPEAILVLLSKTILILKKVTSKSGKKNSMQLMKKVDLLYVEMSTTKNRGDTPNSLLLKMFGEPYCLNFKLLSCRKQFEGLIATMQDLEVESAVRRMNIDIASCLPPVPARRKTGEDDPEKVQSLLTENSHLAQQLAKISISSASGITGRVKSTRGKPEEKKIVFLFYGPRFAGKTTLAKYFIHHCRDTLQTNCAYIAEDQLHITALDPTQKRNLSLPGSAVAPVDQQFGHNLVQAVLATEIPRYEFIVIDGSFRRRPELDSLLTMLEEQNVQTISVCCYGPYSLRQQRNKDNETISQCQPFQMPAKSSIFVDTSKPVSEIFQTQFIPVLSALGFAPSKGHIVPGVSPRIKDETSSG